MLSHRLPIATTAYNQKENIGLIITNDQIIFWLRPLSAIYENSHAKLFDKRRNNFGLLARINPLTDVLLAAAEVSSDPYSPIDKYISPVKQSIYREK